MGLAYQRDNALNAICPYFTMFPLEYPSKVLRKHRFENPVVLDPFCGRGTTLFSARKLQLNAWGVDSSPVAVAIARAKLASCSVEAPLALAKTLIEAIRPKSIPRSSFFRSAYRLRTLQDLCALREGLLGLSVETDASAVLRAAALGCLHGPLSKYLSGAGYFSNQMPRTYASKPHYAVGYWRKHRMTAPKVDVLEVLRRKLSRLVGLSSTSPNSIQQVLTGDSQCPRVFAALPENASVVVTSPPYYGMRTYVQDQWLRNWFLGGPDHVDYGAGPQLSHGGQATFAKSLGKVWANVGKSSSETLHMYVRFGAIPSASVRVKDLFRASLEESGLQWRVVSVRSADSASLGKRQAEQMKASSQAAVEFDFHVERR
jgi:DNA methylase